jgi:Co/Zn/Cd efflux system component
MNDRHHDAPAAAGHAHADHEHDHSHGHGHHHHDLPPAGDDPAYRRVLWIALVVNLAMFVAEVGVGWSSRSVALWADALDFAGDSASYALSLGALAIGAVWRSRTAALKGAVMMLFGAVVLARGLWATWAGEVPEAFTMGGIAIVAFTANLGVAGLLYAWRNGDADMRSVWLCSRNDALGNLAVLAAAAGVWGSASRWPDLAVALVMAGLALSSGWTVWRLARRELARAG